MKKNNFVFIICLFISLQAYSQLIEKTIYHDGLDRLYYLHLPQGYDAATAYPLIIALHGGGGKAKKFNKSTKGRFNELSDSEQFIVAYPQAYNKHWNDHPDRMPGTHNTTDDIGFINAMLQQVKTQYTIDDKNIFACGISNGGLMAATLGFKLPTKIKAVGMVSSNFSEVFSNQIKIDSTIPTPFSFLVIYGTKDPIFPYTEGDITAFKKKRGRVIGVDKTINMMCDLNGNTTTGIEIPLPDDAPYDRCTSIQIDYPNTTNPGLKVRLIKVIGGGHTWPGGYQYFPKKIIGTVTKDFNAADKLWAFFKECMAN